MTLVEYPSSDDSENEDAVSAPHGAKSAVKSDLPSLPNTFHDLYATSVRTSTSDDPALHGGRKRATPHVAGSWPSHVYFEWYPTTTAITSLNAVLFAIEARSTQRARLHSLLSSDLGASLPLHISLSAALSLTTDNKDVFLDVLTNSLSRVQGLNTFEVGLDQLLWAPNHDRSRWFLVVGIRKPGGDELNKILHCCNSSCRQFDLATLYTPVEAERAGKTASAAPIRRQKSTHIREQDDYSDFFHFSIGWMLEDPEESQKDFGIIDKQLLSEISSIKVRFDSVKVKIGNTISSVSLHKDAKRKRGILG